MATTLPAHPERRVPAQSEIDAVIASQAAWAAANGVAPEALESIDMWTNEVGDSDDWVEITTWTPVGWLTSMSLGGETLHHLDTIGHEAGQSAEG
jgi:hypothetical protein